MARNTKRTPESAARNARIVELRRQRVHFDVIGRELGISKQRAFELYRQTVAEAPNMQVDEHRVEEGEVCDTAYNQLLALIMSPDTTDRIKVDALNTLKGWAEHKAKLFGLNAPTKHEVTTLDQLDRELAELDLQLGQLDAPASVENGGAA